MNLRLNISVLALFFSLWVGGCLSAYRQIVGSEIQVLGRYYLTDFNTAWKAVLESLEGQPLDITNRESGSIQTKWIDNTIQKNFTDSFGLADTYNKAQYRLKITLARGFYQGKPSVKVTIQKEQLVQKDVLDGWRNVETDLIEENTLLYRIGRIVFVRTKLARLEDDRVKKEIDKMEQPKPSSVKGEPPVPDSGAIDDVLDKELE